MKPQPGERIGEWALATDDSRLTIGATKDGQLVVSERTNPKVGWNWTGTPSVFPLMKTATVSGVLCDLKWRFSDADGDRTDGHKVTLRLACDAPAGNSPVSGTPVPVGAGASRDADRRKRQPGYMAPADSWLTNFTSA